MLKTSDRLLGLTKEQGGVFTTADAVAAGVTRHAIQWALKTGVLRAVRRGVYTPTAVWTNASPEKRHRLEVMGQQRIHPYLIACETSAAIILALPTPQGPPTRPQLTAARPADENRRGARGARGQQGGHVARRALLSDAEIWTMKSGIRVTSAIRTVLDCARAWDRPWGLAVADAAIRKWDLDPAALVRAAEDRPAVTGHQQVRWVAAQARAQVESPLESLARGIVVLAGLPEPRPQVWVQARNGPYRVDLLDETSKAIIEADGKIKYSTAEDIWREKRREDALRDAGYAVVRFTYADYRHQQEWLVTYRRAITRAHR